MCNAKFILKLINEILQIKQHESFNIKDDFKVNEEVIPRGTKINVLSINEEKNKADILATIDGKRKSFINVDLFDLIKIKCSKVESKESSMTKAEEVIGLLAGIEEAGKGSLKLNVGDKVLVNKKSKGEVFDKEGATHGWYWKEQDSYLIKFDNDTTQYIPAKDMKKA